MQKSYKKLADYFESARSQELPLSVNDIKAQVEHMSELANIAPTPGAAPFTFSKIAAVCSSILVTGAALAAGTWFFTTTHTTQQVEVITTPAERTPTEQAEPITEVLTETIKPVEVGKTAGQQDIINQQAIPTGSQVAVPVREPQAPIQAPVAEKQQTGGQKASSTLEGDKLVAEYQKGGSLPFKVKAESNYKASTEKNKPVAESPETIAGGVHLIELSRPYLEQLGFSINENGILYKNVIERWHSDGKPASMKIEVNEYSQGISFLESTGKPVTPFVPVFISDRKGKQWLKYKTAFEDPRKLEPEYFNEAINRLLPLLVSSEDGRFETVFWFELSKEFIAMLPAVLAAEIEAEQALLQLENKSTNDSRQALNSLEREVIAQPFDESKRAGLPSKENSKSANTLASAESYKYLEGARSNLSIATHISVYPNPSSENVNLSLEMRKADRLRISLVDINGKLLKVLTPWQAFEAGQLTQTYDVRSLPRGMYVLVIESASGQKKTQRVLVK